MTAMIVPIIAANSALIAANSRGFHGSVSPHGFGVALLLTAGFCIWLGGWMAYGMNGDSDSRLYVSIFMGMILPMIVGGLLLL